MDKYQCCICKTIRFLIFPNGDETYIICSACYQELKYNEKFISVLQDT